MKKNSKQCKIFIVEGHLSDWFRTQLFDAHAKRAAKRKAKEFPQGETPSGK
jgi:hypothetical protein